MARGSQSADALALEVAAMGLFWTERRVWSRAEAMQLLRALSFRPSLSELADLWRWGRTHVHEFLAEVGLSTATVRANTTANSLTNSQASERARFSHHPANIRANSLTNNDAHSGVAANSQVADAAALSAGRANNSCSAPSRASDSCSSLLFSPHSSLPITNESSEKEQEPPIHPPLADEPQRRKRRPRADATKAACEIVAFYNSMTGSRVNANAQCEPIDELLRCGVPANEIKFAIIGACHNGFHCGNNDRKHIYLDLMTILKKGRYAHHAAYGRICNFSTREENVAVYLGGRLRMDPIAAIERLYRERDKLLAEEGDDIMGPGAVDGRAEMGAPWPLRLVS